jgi:hypothetical protein
MICNMLESRNSEHQSSYVEKALKFKEVLDVRTEIHAILRHCINFLITVMLFGWK